MPRVYQLDTPKILVTFALSTPLVSLKPGTRIYVKYLSSRDGREVSPLVHLCVGYNISSEFTLKIPALKIKKLSLENLTIHQCFSALAICVNHIENLMSR